MPEVTGVILGLGCGDASAVELLESSLEIEMGLLLNERGMYSGEGDREAISASKASSCHSTSMAAIFTTPTYLETQII
jgi:hypothetical protein